LVLRMLLVLRLDYDPTRKVTTMLAVREAATYPKVYAERYAAQAAGLIIRIDIYHMNGSIALRSQEVSLHIGPKHRHEVMVM
jgi:hypothetical protein